MPRPTDGSTTYRPSLDGVRATDRYPDMRVCGWRAQVTMGWYISDGIHVTSEGYRERGRRIADALAPAFATDGVPSADPVVAPVETTRRR